MKRINRWIAIAFAAILPALRFVQPIVTYASECGGSHVGC